MLEHLYTALRSKTGIILECDDRHIVRQHLYIEIKKAQDPDLKAISLVFSPLNPRHLWLVHRQEQEEENA